MVSSFEPGDQTIKFLPTATILLIGCTGIEHLARTTSAIEHADVGMGIDRSRHEIFGT
jgi:hypothetical protein